MQAETSRSRPMRRLALIAAAPVLAVMISVLFNAAYGTIYVEPLLTAGQSRALQQAIAIFNLLAFPLVVLCWVWLVFSLAPALRPAGPQSGLSHVLRVRLQARAINLPWYFAGLIALANLLCLPVFHLMVAGTGEPLHEDFALHLVVATVIAALITITIAFFLVELLLQSLIFPGMFEAASATEVPGAIPLSLGSRGLLLSLAACVGPILMLLLLGWVDDDQRGDVNHFRLAVGSLGIGFGLVGAWLLGRMVLPPVRALHQAARAVSQGRLDGEIDMVRADEFGTLIEEFNRMLGELRDKQRLRETFGLHVGQAAAKQILALDPGLGGYSQEVTVLFCDIRGFTASSASRPAVEVVARLNRFLGAMVDIVESRHGGMINKYLGDGFMALFGTGGAEAAHAHAAILAAREMLDADIDFAIGIGIHSGQAVVGNIGSPQRLEYTAIGDTVNLAARLEGLTKTLEIPLLFSGAIRQQLPPDIGVRPLGQHMLRGQPEPVEVYTLDRSR